MLLIQILPSIFSHKSYTMRHYMNLVNIAVSSSCLAVDSMQEQKFTRDSVRGDRNTAFKLLMAKLTFLFFCLHFF